MFEPLIFVVKCLGVLVWFSITCTLGTIMALIRYGDIDNDYRMARSLAWGALRCLGIRLDIIGLEHLEAHQPCIYTANHQSNVDLLTFSAIYPHRTLCIGKKEIAKIPFFGVFFKAAGNIMLDRSNHTRAVMGMDVAAERVKKDRASVWIFPEGHRNHEPTMLPFKKGAFHLARLANVPIVPIVISPLIKVIDLPKWRAPGGVMKVHILEPIDSAGHTVESLMKETRSRMEAVHQQLFRDIVPTESKGEVEPHP